MVPTATTRPPRARVLATAAQTVCGYIDVLGMHHVLPDIVDADRLKRACAHMQGHAAALDAGAGQPFEHRRDRSADRQ